MFFLAAVAAYSAPAHAGLRADLDREVGGAPDLAVVCSSASEALTRVEQAVAQIAGADLPPGVRPADGSPPVPGELEAFFAGVRGLFPASGGATEARLTLSWWQDTRTVSFGFDTVLTPHELAQRFLTLNPAAGGALFEGPDSWGIREADGDEMRVQVANGWAHVTHGPIAAHAARSLPPAMLEAVPETPGCLVAMHIEDGKVGALDVVTHLSFTEGQPATFVATVPGLSASEGIPLGGAVPPVARTRELPQAVMVIGVGLDGVDFSSFLNGKDLRQARRFQRLFPVTGGTTVALLQMEPSPRVAAVIPFAGHMPARKVARRTLRLAKHADLAVERLDATHLTVSAGPFVILATASDNRLDLSTDRAALPAGAQVGEPWVSGGVAELAATWPILLTTRILPTGAGPARVLPRPMYVALDLEDGLVKGVIDVPLPLGEIAALAKQLGEARKTSEAATAAPGDVY
ncbi:MAG: hypothetical protein Q8P18_09670 [Pseudomonadota bacterium]|nr:hypothetical protein [Pseudomonadota bacterium]